MGMTGIAPTIVGMSKGIPTYIMDEGESHLVTYLNVPVDSPIKSLDDLVRKKGILAYLLEPSQNFLF